MNAWLNHHPWLVAAVYLGLTAVAWAGYHTAAWWARRGEANLRRQETEAGIIRLEHYANTGETRR